jgi:hypothetical protein
LDSMVNTCESLQRRYQNKPNGADRLGPKGMWPGMEADNSFIADVVPPAYGRNLTCPGTYTEHDNPEYLPYG